MKKKESRRERGREKGRQTQRGRWERLANRKTQREGRMQTDCHRERGRNGHIDRKQKKEGNRHV